MKVLLLNGSPHEYGCTYTALKIVADSLNEEGIDTEIFWTGVNVYGCVGCKKCKEIKKCIIDDKVNEFVEKAKLCDGFIFGSPVHFSSASAIITSFLDRAFYSAKSVFLYKPASVITTARRAGTTSTIDQLNKYLSISQMPIISSKYWNMVHGNTKEEVLKDIEGVQIMKILGKNMSYYLKCIELGKKSGLKIPSINEELVLTNYIN